VLPHHSTPSLPCSTRTLRDTRSFSPSYWCSRIFITSSALYLHRLGFSYSGYRTASHNTLGTRRLKLSYNHLHISRQHLLRSAVGVVRWCARHTSPYELHFRCERLCITWAFICDLQFAYFHTNLSHSYGLLFILVEFSLAIARGLDLQFVLPLIPRIALGDNGRLQIIPSRSGGTVLLPVSGVLSSLPCFLTLRFPPFLTSQARQIHRNHQCILSSPPHPTPQRPTTRKAN
jgi:hypothetical protein